MCLLSQLVPVLNDTHELSRIIHQLLHISLCVYSISLNLAIFLLSVILSDNKDHGISGPQNSMYKCHCNFHAFKFAMKILLVQSGLLSFQIHSFPLLDTLNSHPKVECHVTHFTL